MTITIQIDEFGKCALPEHRQELQKLLSKFSEREVDITVTDITVFSENSNRAVDLQNDFNKAVNEPTKKWTNEEFAALRAKMAAANFMLFDMFAVAKSDEKNADIERQFVLDKAKVEFSENFAPSLSSTKAKASAEYMNANKIYLEKYKERVYLELLISSLEKSMNAIAGILKQDGNMMKF